MANRCAIYKQWILGKSFWPCIIQWLYGTAFWMVFQMKHFNRERFSHGCWNFKVTRQFWLNQILFGYRMWFSVMCAPSCILFSCQYKPTSRATLNFYISGTIMVRDWNIIIGLVVGYSSTLGFSYLGTGWYHFLHKHYNLL